jgi:hypothetical protein
MAAPTRIEKSAREEGDSGETYCTRAGRRSTTGAAYPESTDGEGAVGGAPTAREQGTAREWGEKKGNECSAPDF